MAKLKLTMAFLALAGTVFANPAPAGYKYQEFNGGVVFSDDFSRGLKYWKEWKNRKDTYRIVSGAGDNGSAGVVFERKKHDQPQSLLRYYFDTAPGENYEAKVLCKVENCTSSTIARSKLQIHLLIVSHFDKDGRSCGEKYSVVRLNGKTGFSWREEKLEFTVPPGTVKTAVALGFCYKNMAGRASFDNFSLEKKGTQKALIYPVLPKQYVLGRDGTMKFRIFDYKGRSDSALRFCVRIDGKEYFTDIKNSFAELKVTVPTSGNCKTTVFLLDEKEKTVAGKEEYTFRVMDSEKAPAGSCVIDEQGKLKIDGKNFLPVGIFCNSDITHADVKKIKNGGFNCIMPYKSLLLSVNSGKTRKNSTARVKRALDYLNKYDLKVMFCLYEQVRGGVKRFDRLRDPIKIAEYAVGKFRRHPAVLGWYVSDENRVSDLDVIRQLRENFSLQDPWHPVFTLNNKPDNHLDFAQTGDVLLADHYPVRDENSKTMSTIRPHFRKASEAGIGVWFVPQAFNWGAYRTKDTSVKYRYPTELEMRSMVLLAMNLGAKGYCFYIYHAPGGKLDKYDPAALTWFWPQICNVAKLLRELEEFFFTDDVKNIACSYSKQNKVEVKLYTSGKKHCAVITCDGPGKAKAVFRLPENLNLKSRYGHTHIQEDGSYKFTCNDIGSDILTDF